MKLWVFDRLVLEKLFRAVSFSFIVRCLAHNFRNKFVDNTGAGMLTSLLAVLWESVKLCEKCTGLQ